MDMQQILRMNPGAGKLSYANNSLAQSALMERTKPYIEKALLQVFTTTKPTTLNVADLGCASGPSALLAVDMILDVVKRSCEREAADPCLEMRAFLNDLTGNDFNNVFKAIPSFYQKHQVGKDGMGSCFISATPGSFYGRLFPRESLHFVYSANSVHWLSQVLSAVKSQSPLGLTGKNCNLNKGNIGLGTTSPVAAFEAYAAQFRRDFTTFLKSRAEEIVPGGCMVLLLKGRNTLDHSSEERDPFWSAFAPALEDMIKEGVVEEEKVDSFNIPYHEAHIKELGEIVEAQGSFDIVQLEEISFFGDYLKKFDPLLLAQLVRAATEPLLVEHFGGGVMDRLFDKYKEKLALDKFAKAVSLVLSLAKKV